MSALEQIQNTLNNNGTVLVSTCTRSIVYYKKHAGMFFEKNGELRVQHGKGSVCLIQNNGLQLVNIKLYATKVKF